MRSKASLGSSREVAQGCGVSFVNYLYLVPLIIGQNFYAICATSNKTGPRTVAHREVNTEAVKNSAATLQHSNIATLLSQNLQY